MTPEQYARLTEAFINADDLEPTARRAAIEDALADDPAVLERAVDMLDTEHRVDTLCGKLDVPMATPPRPDRDPVIGQTIGAYTIIRRIGQGATGAVFEAEQRSPKRCVAIKLLHALTVSPRLAQRFELEGEILGRLRHPNIASVYETGVEHAAGVERRFIAMELIDGEPITVWAKGPAADPRRVIEAFIRVCDAVHEAHQRGFIHRDLKPANILIDHQGDPKLLDFGIARAIDEEQAESPLTTATLQGEILGTLAYMSPEQAAGEPDAISIRTDIYALGAVLCELVSGAPPVHLDHMPLQRALETLREGPLRNIRVSGTIADADLSAIIATATATEPKRRYVSAEALADDLRRVLSNDPVLARAPSMSYQLLKFAKRRRAAFIAASIAASALLAATVISTAFALSEANARAAADEARRLAEQSQREAEIEREHAEQTLALITESLNAANPVHSERGDYSVRELLGQIAASIDDPQRRLRPVTEALLRSIIGDAFLALADPEAALPHLYRAAESRREQLGTDHPDTIESESFLALALTDLDRLDEAQDILVQLVERSERTLGFQHPTTISVRHYLASNFFKLGQSVPSERFFRDNLAASLAVHGENHEATASAMTSLSIVLRANDKLDEALELSGRAAQANALVLGPEHPSALMSRHNHAMLQLDAGDAAEALKILTEVLEVRTRVLPPDHRHIGVNEILLARAYEATNDLATAREYARSGYQRLARTLGPSHRYTVSAREQFDRLNGPANP